MRITFEGHFLLASGNSTQHYQSSASWLLLAHEVRNETYALRVPSYMSVSSKNNYNHLTMLKVWEFPLQKGKPTDHKVTRQRFCQTLTQLLSNRMSLFSLMYEVRKFTYLESRHSFSSAFFSLECDVVMKLSHRNRIPGHWTALSMRENMVLVVRFWSIYDCERSWSADNGCNLEYMTRFDVQFLPMTPAYGIHHAEIQHGNFFL